MADFILGDYQYTIIDSTNHYVQARTYNKSRAAYTDIPPQVKCNNVTYTVIDISSCFQDCINLIIAPNIPEGVTNLYQCFQRCTSLTTICSIPATTINIEYCFDGCNSLQGGINIYGNAITSYTNVFNNTMGSITIIDHNRTASSIWQTIANSYNNIVYKHSYALVDVVSTNNSLVFGRQAILDNDRNNAKFNWQTFLRKNLYIATDSTNPIDGILLQLIENLGWTNDVIET